MAQKFSWKQDIKKVDWGSTLKYNLMRAVSAGIVWGFLMLITNPAKNALPALFAPIFFPVIYLFLVTVVVGILSLYARSPLPFGELVAGITMLFWAFVVAVGDPLVYLLHKRKPGFVPVDQPRFFDFHLIVFVLRNQFQPKSVPRAPIVPPNQIAQVSAPPNQLTNPPPQSPPPSSGNQVPVSMPVASGSFFKSKPFIMLVVIAAALCGGVALFKSLSDKTTLSFDFSIDGKGLPSGKVPDVRVDGQPFTSGSKIKMGRHELTVQLQDVEPLEKHYWILFGAKNLGTLPLEFSKGSLIVAVNPSPASVTVQSAGETVRQGDAPLNVEKLPVGDYMLVVRRGEYEESHSVKIQREQQTKAQIDLNLGSVDLSVEPTNAEFELSGNGRHWQGSLPIHIDDVPAGDYSLLTRRKGWELNADVSVSRGNTTTNETEFPYGSIELTSDPAGLVISTNGIEIGKTPIRLQELKPAQYTLTASDGENDLIADIDVAPKEAAKHVFVFHYGTVQLSSTPTGATVIRKGKEIGKTPLTLNHIPAGETMVELQLQDYVSTNYSIHLVENVTLNLSVKLISEHYVQAMKQAQEFANNGQLYEGLKAAATAMDADSESKQATDLWNNLTYRIHIQNSAVFLSNHQFQDALAELDQAEKFSPNSQAAAQLRIKITEQKSEYFENVIHKANNLYSANDFKDASSQLDEAEKLNPNSPEVANLREKMLPALRERNWGDFTKRFSGLSGLQSKTLVWKYRKSLTEVQDGIRQGVKGILCAWKLQNETNLNDKSVTMELVQAGLLSSVAYKRTCAIMLSQLDDGTVEMRVKFWVYADPYANPNIVRQTLDVNAQNLMVNLKGPLGESIPND